MRIHLWLGGLMVPVALGCAACSGTSAPNTQTSSAELGCKPGAALQGGVYDINKSHFAFGSTPMRAGDATLTRWIGVDGVVGINANGSELGIMNAGAPETNLPDFSSDSAALQTHVTDYFGSMGVESCQISHPDVTSGSGGTAIVLTRGINGIPVVESNASARFNSSDETTTESFYWPTLPTDTVAAAEALSTRITDPTTLAEYQALLPAEAQSTGRVVIHHTSASSKSPFHSAATYDVQEAGGVLGSGPTISFDAQGMPVASDW